MPLKMEKILYNGLPNEEIIYPLTSADRLFWT